MTASREIFYNTDKARSGKIDQRTKLKHTGCAASSALIISIIISAARVGALGIVDFLGGEGEGVSK